MKIKIMHPEMQMVTEVPVSVFTFSGGEQHVKIDANELALYFPFAGRVVIQHEIRTSADFMTVVMVKNAIDHMLNFIHHYTDLVMLYVPYARQDRVCEKGEAFGLEAFGDLLNSLKFDRVIVADPHSDVTPSVINNLFVIPQEEIAFHTLKWKLKMENFSLVSPDGGALKKIFKLSKMMGLEVFCADKIRDTATGDIIRTNINVDDFEGKNLMIIDDICKVVRDEDGTLRQVDNISLNEINDEDNLLQPIFRDGVVLIPQVNGRDEDFNDIRARVDQEVMKHLIEVA